MPESPRREVPPTTIQVLSLLQPWATLVAVGAKKIETRSWRTEYRGPLAIHASKRMGGAEQVMCDYPPIRDALRAAGITAWSELPLGAIIATCTLVSCLHIVEQPFFQQDLERNYHPHPGVMTPPEKPERDFGDYGPGRYAWLLADVVALPEPIPARGSLGLWTFDLERVAQP